VVSGVREGAAPRFTVVTSDYTSPEFRFYEAELAPVGAVLVARSLMTCTSPRWLRWSRR
jgi:hypothetical protein